MKFLTSKLDFNHIVSHPLMYIHVCLQDEKSVDDLSTQDLLQKHVKRAKKVRAR